MTARQHIDCLECGAKIYFEVTQLLAGNSFSCGKCDASIALAKETSSQVEDAMKKFEGLKKKLDT